MTDDAELLRRYAEENAEEAFAEFVRRNLGLVYHAALRQCGGDGHRAQDVAQAVFTDVARKARSLARRPALAGWLHTSTRYAAAQAVRGEVRRQRREQEAHAMNEILAKANGEDAAAAEWERMRPVIDEALHGLSERDREAVLARFFEGRAFAEIGARLRMSEDAARMRVERALEKLRAALVKRGITSTTAALGVALANQAAAVVPAGLVASVTGAALAGASSAVVVGGIFTFMSTTKIMMGVAAAVALAAVGAAIYEADQVKRRDERLAEAVRQQTAMQAKITNLEGRLKAESGRAEAAEADSAKLLEAVESFKKGMGAKAVEANKPITREVVEARFKRAQELAAGGQLEVALRDYLWCYDEGMVRVASFSGVRGEFLPDLIANLGERYPAALTALRERRDEAGRRMAASASDAEATSTFAALNRTLKENDRTLAALDPLPPGDPRRRGLGNVVFDQLVERGSYGDALRGKPYTAMNTAFEFGARAKPSGPAMPNVGDVQQRFRAGFITMTAKNIEVLAGAGEAEDARTLAGRLLKFDGSEATRALVQKHLARAGQPGLLEAGAAEGK
jgi:RNA polymerase sigma factor (sigma-70 family)